MIPRDSFEKYLRKTPVEFSLSQEFSSTRMTVDIHRGSPTDLMHVVNALKGALTAAL